MALSLLLSRYLFDTHLAKDLCKNGRNTPKMFIFWNYKVGGSNSTWGLDGGDFFNHTLL